MKPRLAVTIVTVLVLAFGFFVRVEPAGASATFRVATWNLAQGNDDYDQLYANKVLVAVANMQSAFTWQLSLQEACQGQSDQIVWALNVGGGGYTRHFGSASSGSEHCAPFGYGPYGNAVLNIGTPLAPYGGLRYHVLNPHAPPAENKNVVCGGMQNIGFRYEGCSLHTTPYSWSYALPQMGDALTQTSIFGDGDGAWHVTGGDFNYPYVPPVSGMDVNWRNWFGTHDEAWVPYVRSTFNSGSMIDYIFADRRVMQQWGTAYCSFYSYSDHGYCPGLFLLH